MPCCKCKKKKKRYEWLSDDNWVCINCYVRLIDKRVRFLESGIQSYYMAIYKAKQRADWTFREVIGVTVMCGAEEVPEAMTKEELKRVIKDLPLKDYGC